MSSAGYLKLWIGPMFSGKTTQLIQAYKKYTFIGKTVCVINYTADNRYHETMLSTHDKVMIPCIQTNRLMDVWNYKDLEDEYSPIAENHMKMRSAEVILINEAQFFEDLVECVESMLQENKTIYISGLDGDFERKKFGNIIDLIPLCDKVTKLASLCNLCKNGTPGIFSLRLTSDKQQMLIGSDNYIPVCRSCYTMNNSTSSSSSSL